MAGMMEFDTVVELKKGTAPPLGWGFAVAGTGNVHQVQRWLFAKPDLLELQKSLPPRGDVEWNSDLSPSSPFNGTESLAEFKNVVQGKWSVGTHVYAKVHTTRTTFDPQKPTLPKDPTFPPYPSPSPPGSDQFDVGTIQAMQNGDVLGHGWTGWPNTQQAHEAWVLVDGFEASEVTIYMGTKVSTFMTTMNEKVWAAGSELVLASVNYYLTPLPAADL